MCGRNNRRQGKNREGAVVSAVLGGTWVDAWTEGKGRSGHRSLRLDMTHALWDRSALDEFEERRGIL